MTLNVLQCTSLQLELFLHLKTSYSSVRSSWMQNTLMWFESPCICTCELIRSQDETQEGYNNFYTSLGDMKHKRCSNKSMIICKELSESEKTQFWKILEQLLSWKAWSASWVTFPSLLYTNSSGETSLSDSKSRHCSACWILYNSGEKCWWL